MSPTRKNVGERSRNVRGGQRTKSLSPLSFNNDSIVGKPLDAHEHTHIPSATMPREAFPQRDYISAIENVFFTEGNLEHECLEAFIINGLPLLPSAPLFLVERQRANSKKLPESSPFLFLFSKLINQARMCRRAV